MSSHHLFLSAPPGLTPSINSFMHTMHISHHLLQCKPHTDEMQLKEHKHTGCGLKLNNQSNLHFLLPKHTPGRSVKEPPFSFRPSLVAPGETSQNLCNKLNQCTTRRKVPESSACRNINQNLTIHTQTVRRLLASTNKSPYWNS